MNKFLTLCLLLISVIGYSQQTLYSRTTANTWSLTNGGANCGCFPTSVDTVEISHNWANPSFYPLTHPANLAFGTYFPVSSANNPYKVVIRSGGVGYQTGTIPTGMILQVDNGGMWAFNGGVTFNTSALNSIALINNEGSILVNGSFVNNLAINSPGEFCTTGSFTQNLGGTFNGLTDANLAPHYTHTNYGGFANCLQMVVLPIELLSFKANVQDNGIIYSWSTASEINNDYFELLVSKDINDWKVIDMVRGAGNSFSILNYYSYSNELDYSYAKLRQTDYDGQYVDSYIISLDKINVYNDNLLEVIGSKVIVRTMDINNIEMSFNIYSINGQVLYTKLINNSQVIDLKNLDNNLILTVGIKIIGYGNKREKIFVSH